MGGLPKLDQVRSTNVAAQRDQRALQQWTERARACPFLDGELIEGVDMAAAVDRQVNHHLGRIPSGWFLLDMDIAAMVYRVAWTNRTIVLNASANLVADLWVF